MKIKELADVVTAESYQDIYRLLLDFNHWLDANERVKDQFNTVAAAVTDRKVLSAAADLLLEPFFHGNLGLFIQHDGERRRLAGEVSDLSYWLLWMACTPVDPNQKSMGTQLNATINEYYAREVEFANFHKLMEIKI